MRGLNGYYTNCQNQSSTIQVAEVYALWRAVARPAVALAKAGPSIQFLERPLE